MMNMWKVLLISGDSSLPILITMLQYHLRHPQLEQGRSSHGSGSDVYISPSCAQMCE